MNSHPGSNASFQKMLSLGHWNIFLDIQTFLNSHVAMSFHIQYLNSGSENSDKEPGVLRGSEDVAVNQLPSGFFDALLHVLVSVVLGNVSEIMSQKFQPVDHLQLNRHCGCRNDKAIWKTCELNFQSLPTSDKNISPSAIQHGKSWKVHFRQ